MSAPVERASEDAPSLALLRVTGFALRQRRLIALSAITWGIAALGFSVLKPRTYSATVAFTPSVVSSPRGLGQLAGLASQLGLQFDIGNEDQSDFYVALVGSRTILERVISDTYRIKEPDGTYQVGDLRELLHVGNSRPSERTWRTVKRLRKMIAARGSRQTNIIEVKVEAKNPDLAESIADRLFVAVNEFDLNRRQLQAGSERRFIESRVAAAESSLAQAESTLATFLYRNRSYQDSPALTLEHDKLARRVDLRHQVLTSLVQSLEKAKIDEVRNTSVIVPIDQPRGSAVPDPSGLLLTTVLGLSFGGLLGIFLAAIKEGLHRGRYDYPDEFAKVQSLAGEVLASTRRLVSRRTRSTS